MTNHNVAVWARDVRRTTWAWSCGCGTRYTADLPDIEAARDEARAHASQRVTVAPEAPVAVTPW